MTIRCVPPKIRFSYG